jgi:hypothetical protein
MFKESEMTTRLTNAQVGMLGVHLTASELIRRGLIVAATSREAQGADLLVTDPACQRTWSVQVKATQNRKAYYCLVGKGALNTSSSSHVWVFVNFEDDLPHFMVVPSKIIAKHVRRQPDRPDGWLVFDRKHAPTPNAPERQWDVFGKASRVKLPLKRSPAIPSEA